MCKFKESQIHVRRAKSGYSSQACSKVEHLNYFLTVAKISGTM